MKKPFAADIRDAIADRGRSLLGLNEGASKPELRQLCRDLLKQRGDASGLALAREIVAGLPPADAPAGDSRWQEFFEFLLTELVPDAQALEAALERYSTDQNIQALATALESPRQELFRRINVAPGATTAIVSLRDVLLRHIALDEKLAPIDVDLKHVVSAWFNPGFFFLRKIDWHTPAAVLERLIAYEAVHEIRGWQDLRRRLESDRRCFAFFHPALPDEPLVFVEVALVQCMAHEIQPLLATDAPVLDEANATHAIFYSISACQDGLRGISFGAFLLKRVIEELRAELPMITSFATLSPVPNFSRWLKALETSPVPDVDGELLTEVKRRARLRDWNVATDEDSQELEAALTGLCAYYFLNAKRGKGPLDAVARFHLRNGARLERLNPMGDTSDKGLKQSCGMLVNYRYERKYIEENHESYLNDGTIICSKGISKLVDG